MSPRKDARVAYTTSTISKHEDYITRTSTACIQLGDRYTELHGYISGRTVEQEGKSSSAPFGKPPVRLDILDALRDVEEMTRHQVSLVRGVLRLGMTPATGKPVRQVTVTGLVWISRSLKSAWEADPDTGRDAARDVWRQHRRTGYHLGIIPKAFRIDQECPQCGNQSLWADPATWMAACGADGCDYIAPVNAPALAWSSGPESGGSA